MTYDPAFTNTASCKSAITFIDGDKGILRVPGLPDRGAGREVDVPRGRLAPPEGRAADGRRAEGVHAPRHDPHVPPREHRRSSWRASGTTRTRWGCCSRRSARSRRSTRTPSRSSTRSRATTTSSGSSRRCRRSRPSRTGTRIGFPYVYPDNDLSYTGNFLSMMKKMAEPRYDVEPGPRARARRPLHPPRRPRAELLDERDALGRLGADRPVLVASRPPRRRSTARSTAARTRPSCGCCTRSATSRTSRPS